MKKDTGFIKKSELGSIIFRTGVVISREFSNCLPMALHGHGLGMVFFAMAMRAHWGPWVVLPGAVRKKTMGVLLLTFKSARRIFNATTPLCVFHMPPHLRTIVCQNLLSEWCSPT